MFQISDDNGRSWSEISEAEFRKRIDHLYDNVDLAIHALKFGFDIRVITLYRYVSLEWRTVPFPGGWSRHHASTESAQLSVFNYPNGHSYWFVSDASGNQGMARGVCDSPDKAMRAAEEAAGFVILRSRLKKDLEG